MLHLVSEMAPLSRPHLASKMQHHCSGCLSSLHCALVCLCTSQEAPPWQKTGPRMRCSHAWATLLALLTACAAVQGKRGPVGGSSAVWQAAGPLASAAAATPPAHLLWPPSPICCPSARCGRSKQQQQQPAVADRTAAAWPGAVSSQPSAGRCIAGEIG